MSRQALSYETRRRVAERAHFQCEYCLVDEEDSFLAYQIDHIISIKHGGGDSLDNLAYSCVSCNRAKGSDIGSILLPEKEFIRLFNPREDAWEDHFRLVGAEIIPITSIGKATVKVLDLNNQQRIAEREALLEAGRYTGFGE